MRVARPVILNAEQREALEQRARARSLPARVVERSRIVLLAAEGKKDLEIAATLKITPKKAARWRARFLRAGLAGLEKDAPRAGRAPSITLKMVRQIIRKTTQEKPLNGTHWSTRTMAAASGISQASIRRIWRAHGLKPHRMETFKIGNDSELAGVRGRARSPDLA